MFCRRKGRFLRRGIAAFLLLAVAGSSGAFAVENTDETIAAQQSETAAAAQETQESLTEEPEQQADDGEFESVGTVTVEADSSSQEEVLDEIRQDNGAVVFSQVVPTSKKVRLYYNKTVRYESYRTHDFHVKFDGQDLIAYCIEPTKKLKGKRVFTAEPCNSQLLSKALYYSYGQPGYKQKTAAYLKGVSRKSCYKGSEGIYALCHVMLSYVYDGESGKGDAFKGCSSGTKKVVRNFVAAIKKWPDPPGEPQLGLSSGRVKAVWNEETMQQETEEIEVLGTPENSISVPVPEGAAVVKDGESISTGTVEVNTGEKFRLTAPAEVQGEYSSPAMEGRLKGFQPYIIRPSDTQNQLFSVSTIYSISYSVDWVDFGRVELIKKSADESVTADSSYYSLEKAKYDLYSRESGKAYGSFVTDSAGRAVLENIPYGEYIIKESEAPAGYDIDSNEHLITVSSEFQSETVMDEPLVPDIITYAAEKDTGSKSVASAGDIVISDMVKYSRVQPGKTYRITGRLVDKATGEEIPGTAEELEFTAEESEGSFKMDYPVNAGELAGKTAVAFEKLYYGDEVIAVHEDIESRDQSVSFTVPSDSSPKMGDGAGPALPVLLMMLSLSAAGMIWVTVKLRGIHRTKALIKK